MGTLMVMKFKTRAGEIYTGQFKNGSRNGKGVLNNVDGSNYTGFFKDGLFHGLGVFTSPDNKVISGEFENGKIKLN